MTAAVAVPVERRRRFTVPQLDDPLPADLLGELDQLMSISSSLIPGDLLFARLEKEVEVSRRWQRPLGLLLVRMEGLQDVVRVLGEGTEEEVVQRVGEQIRRSTRATDALGHWSVDELAVLLPEAPIDGVSVVQRRIERLLTSDALGVTRHGRRRNFDLGLRFGAAAWTLATLSGQELWAEAYRDLISGQAASCKLRAV